MENNNFRQATACENCRFAGFKAAYHGGKRVTGLCLHYQSDPAIDYTTKPGQFPQLLGWFHEELRRQETLNPRTFDEVWKDVPHQTYRNGVMDVYGKYKAANLKMFDTFFGLPESLTIDDWPLIVARWLQSGMWCYGIGAGGHPLNINGKTNEEIVEPMREYYDLIVMYHRGWRDYFANSPVTKIKRTTVCDLHEPIPAKKRARRK